MRRRFIELGGDPGTTAEQVVPPLKRILRGRRFERVRSGFYRYLGAEEHESGMEIRDGQPALVEESRQTFPLCTTRRTPVCWATAMPISWWPPSFAPWSDPTIYAVPYDGPSLRDRSGVEPSATRLLSSPSSSRSWSACSPRWRSDRPVTVPGSPPFGMVKSKPPSGGGFRWRSRRPSKSLATTSSG